MQALRRRRRPVTATALAAELGVSVRTVYRDIGTLVAGGAAIEGEAGFGYILREGHFLPPLMFTADEADAVILGLRMVERRADPDLADAALEALAKIAAVLPPERDGALDVSTLSAGPPVDPSARAVLAVLRQAMRAEHKLRIRYEDGQGVTSQRTVWPILVAFFRDVEVLAAWCELRRDFRHFRLDRIAAAEPSGERYPTRRRILLAEWRLLQNIDEGS